MPSAPLNSSPCFRGDNKESSPSLRPSQDNTGRGHRLYLSGGSQGDWEIQLRKLATHSAETDAHRALVILPEPGGVGGETQLRGHVMDQPATRFR